VTVRPVDTTRVPPWCLRLTSELDAADARAIAIVKDLSIVQLNWKAGPDAWSVGQCLEHLCLSNEVYVEPMAEALNGSPAGRVAEITPGWFGRWFFRKYIEPTTQKKRGHAPRRAVPVADHLDSSILDRFIASNAKIRNVITRAETYDVNRVRFKNPFVPLIRFSVGTGLQIIARHNHRHLLQAERVSQLPDFPHA
jgi:hypothetical protein